MYYVFIIKTSKSTYIQTINHSHFPFPEINYFPFFQCLVVPTIPIYD